MEVRLVRPSTVESIRSNGRCNEKNKYFSTSSLLFHDVPMCGMECEIGRTVDANVMYKYWERERESENASRWNRVVRVSESVVARRVSCYHKRHVLDAHLEVYFSRVCYTHPLRWMEPRWMDGWTDGRTAALSCHRIIQVGESGARCVISYTHTHTHIYICIPLYRPPLSDWTVALILY